MFKIKVGLKSFQTHSMQRCKHQIERIVSYLKQSQTSSPISWNGREESSIRSLFEKDGTTLRKKPASLFLNKKTHQNPTYTPTLREQVSMRDSGQLQLPIKKRGSTSIDRVDKQIHLIEPASLFDMRGRRSPVLKRGGFPFIAVERPSNQKNRKIGSFFGTTPLPTLTKKMTTLRSPHIDKKSREQFEWKREKAQIYFDLNSVPQISFVLFILTHSRFPAVEIEIGVESKTYFA